MHDLLAVVQSIVPLHQDWCKNAQNHLNQLTKPPGSLGRLENLAIQLVGMSEQLSPRFDKKAILVMAADHGVCEEGVSNYPQSVTGQMVVNFLRGGAAVNVLAKQVGAEVFCCDFGTKTDFQSPNLRNFKVRYGTANICIEPAMSEHEAETAISHGISIVNELSREGFTCFATGEMGIGNTTVSSSLLCVMLEKPASELVGIGTGIDLAKMSHKQAVIEKAVARYHESRHYLKSERISFSIELLSQLGGLEIAGLVGVILGAAKNRRPIVIDGFISTAAAVIAAHLCPTAKQYMIPSHQSMEPGHLHALAYLDLQAMIQLDMRLGEGTGAALCFPFIDYAVAIMSDMATFSSAGVDQQIDG